MTTTPLYTVGYGARDITAFIQVLQTHGIAYVIDVRSKPYSRYKPDFSKDALERHLQEVGIRYVFMGDVLGGQPQDPACYTEDGKVDYDQCRLQPAFQEGIGRLRRAWEQKLSVALMCSEGKPEECHRSKLIAPAIEENGMTVAHIDEGDRVLQQDEVMLRLTKGRLSLFGNDADGLTSNKRYLTDMPEQEDPEPDV